MMLCLQPTQSDLCAAWFTALCYAHDALVIALRYTMHFTTRDGCQGLSEDGPCTSTSISELKFDWHLQKRPCPLAWRIGRRRKAAQLPLAFLGGALGGNAAKCVASQAAATSMSTNSARQSCHLVVAFQVQMSLACDDGICPAAHTPAAGCSPARHNAMVRSRTLSKLLMQKTRDVLWRGTWPVLQNVQGCQPHTCAHSWQRRCSRRAIQQRECSLAQMRKARVVVSPMTLSGVLCWRESRG